MAEPILHNETWQEIKVRDPEFMDWVTDYTGIDPEFADGIMNGVPDKEAYDELLKRYKLRDI